MTRLLLAGFGPFPGTPANPSADLVKLLARRRRPAFLALDISTHVFATAYAAVDCDLPRLFAAKPDIVVIFGLAPQRRELCVETRARNAVSTLFPDAGGYRPRYAVIERGAPPTLNGKAPFARLLGAARSRGVPARLSRDAGCYLCNYAYWRALRRGEGGALVQFIHIPIARRAPRRRSKRPLVSLDALAVAAEAILIALVAASRR